MLEYQVVGDLRAGVPVLLLRPLAGTMALWGELRDELATTRAVISCHARGIGRSPAASFPTTTRSMARDAARLLDHLRVPAAHVFGLSLGGMVATWLAIDRPALVDGLVLASAPARALDVSRSPRRAAGFVSCIGYEGGRREAGLAEHVLSAKFRREQPARAAQILDQVRRDGGSLRAVLLHAGAAALHDPRRELGRIRAHTLCIAGSLDDLVAPSAVAELARNIPNARFEMIDGAGHDLSLEAPNELASRVAAFLDRCDGRARASA